MERVCACLCAHACMCTDAFACVRTCSASARAYLLSFSCHSSADTTCSGTLLTLTFSSSIIAAMNQWSRTLLLDCNQIQVNRKTPRNNTKQRSVCDLSFVLYGHSLPHHEIFGPPATFGSRGVGAGSRLPANNLIGTGYTQIIARP